MLKIYGSDLSTPANKVRYVANYLGLDYEYSRVNLREGEHKSPEYLKLHPAGKVPVIDDDGFVLFESNAICRYLAEKHSSSLYPKNLNQRAIIDQWVDFSTIHIGAAVNRVVFNRVFANFIKVPVDERSLEDGLNFLERFLPIADQQLSKNTYLAGKEMSVADITLLANLDPAEIAQIDLSTYKNLAKWRDSLITQDFYTKCHKEYGEALKQAS